MPFTLNVMLQLHRMLCRYLPNPGGRWTPTAVERLAANDALAAQMPDWIP